MLAAPQIYKALNPKTEMFPIATACLLFESARSEVYRDYSFEGTGKPVLIVDLDYGTIVWGLVAAAIVPLRGLQGC
jgi:hypothetical protein